MEIYMDREYFLLQPRRVRRAASRELARKFVQRPAPVYVPADPQPVCAEHHRKLPCRRCNP
jgi:hypothetical protein